MAEDKHDTKEILMRIEKMKFVPKHAKEAIEKVSHRTIVNDRVAHQPMQGIKIYREKRFQITK